MTLVGVGLALMSGIDANSDWTALLPGFIIGGAGIGMVNPSLAPAAVGVVPPQRAGMASGINSTFRQVGIATGIAGLGAVFQGLLSNKIPNVPGEVLAAGNPALVRAGADARVPGRLHGLAVDAVRDRGGDRIRVGRALVRADAAERLRRRGRARGCGCRLRPVVA